jgi:hypothetical protein
MAVTRPANARRAGSHRVRVAAIAAIAAGSLGAAGLAVTITVPAASSASSAATAAPSRTTNCSAAPSKCGYPDSTSAGVPAGTKLTSVPAQATSGAGWTWHASSKTVEVTAHGATVTGLRIAGTLDVAASNVTVSKDVVTGSGSNFGVSLQHTAGVTIENSTITGTNTAAGRIGSGIDDIHGNSTGTVIRADNIADFKTAVQVTTGKITGNYIHDPGYIAGDHTNGILDRGTSQTLAIGHNTILIDLGQTDAISLDATGSGQTIANKAVTDNLIGGGSYALYGGRSSGNTISHVTVTGNDFSQASYPASGRFGPVAYFTTAGSGNTWSGNTWDTTGHAVPAP